MSFIYITNNSSPRDISGCSNEIGIKYFEASGLADSVVPALILFSTGDWNAIWIAQKYLSRNFSKEQCQDSVSRLALDSKHLRLLSLAAESMFFTDWNKLTNENYIELCKLLAYNSPNLQARETALYSGLNRIQDLLGNEICSKFSASMNRREIELRKQKFIVELSSPLSLSRVAAIDLLMESVNPGTSVLPKLRAKSGLTEVSKISGIELLRKEIEQGHLKQRIQAAHLLGKLKQKDAILVLIAALTVSDYSLKLIYKEVLDRYYLGVYEWYLLDRTAR